MTDEKRYIGEPVLLPGGLFRLACVIIAFWLTTFIGKTIYRQILPPDPELAPHHIRNLAAECVMNNDPHICAIIWRWRPTR